MYEFETVLVIIDVGNLNQPSTVIFEKTRLHKNELKRPNKHQSSNAILLRLSRYCLSLYGEMIRRRLNMRRVVRDNLIINDTGD